MAASVKDTGKENMDNQAEDDDIRGGDGKKKKFKPLSAVRKFFGGKSKRKKDDGVVAVKAQSTTALHSSSYDQDDEEDDGGFKSHQKTPKPLAGTRSISEDSIFSPEPRDQTPSFPKIAVSEERLPKPNFQSELFNKLNKRRSHYSDDDQDEGIPRSPVPVVTTADVVAEPLKPLIFGKKQAGSTRDSEQSLISVDGSDMEDDLFTTKWKTSVPSRKSSEKPRMSDSSAELENMDFSSIEKTEVLKSTAARDRISIKPQYRRASRLSRKKKESSLSKSLPCLNEESPTRPKAENLSRTVNNKNAMYEEDIDINQLDPKTALPMMKTEKASDSSKPPLSSSAPGKSQDITRIAVASHNSGAHVVTVKNKDENNSPKEKKVNFDDGDNSSVKSKTADLKSKGGSPSLKVSDPDSDVTLSPREDYKLKRQNRSKTLPMGSAEEDSSSKIQRASSHRAPVSNSPSEDKPSIAPASSSVKKLGATRFSQFASSSASSEPSWVNKAKQKKSEPPDVEEQEQKKPSFEDNVRRQSHENVLASASKSQEPAISQSKNVPSSFSGSKDTKKGSTDINSSKVTESEKDKPVDSPSSNNLNSKRPSIDISSMKRTSIDIDVKELSIKQRTASFNNTGKVEASNSNKANPNVQDSSKPKSPTSSTPPSSTSSASLSMAERAKLFSGSNPSSSSSSPSSTAPSSSSKPPAGIGHLRSGSVKTSPTKSTDSNTNTPVKFRAGSVKGTSFSSSGISSSSNIKSDSSSSPNSTVKRETPDNTAVTKPTTLSSSANSKFSSSNSNSPSSTTNTTATPSSFSKTNLPAGKAFSSFSSVAKPPTTTFASASNVSKSNQQVSSSSPTSTTTTTSSPSSSNSSTSKPFSKTQSSPIRSHASFTTTSPFRPPHSSNSPSLSSRSTALSKSTSMKVSSPAPNLTKIEDKKKEVTTTPSNVPAWRANLQKKDVKIEIIEKKTSPTSSPPPSTTQSSQLKNENKFGNNSRVTEMAKKSDSTPTIEKSAVSSSNRSSKVLDMVKNFQNLQVST